MSKFSAKRGPCLTNAYLEGLRLCSLVPFGMGWFVLPIEKNVTNTHPYSVLKSVENNHFDKNQIQKYESPDGLP